MPLDYTAILAICHLPSVLMVLTIIVLYLYWIDVLFNLPFFKLQIRMKKIEFASVKPDGNVGNHSTYATVILAYAKVKFYDFTFLFSLEHIWTKTKLIDLSIYECILVIFDFELCEVEGGVRGDVCLLQPSCKFNWWILFLQIPPPPPLK